MSPPPLVWGLRPPWSLAAPRAPRRRGRTRPRAERAALSPRPRPPLGGAAPAGISGGLRQGATAPLIPAARSGGAARGPRRRPGPLLGPSSPRLGADIVAAGCATPSRRRASSRRWRRKRRAAAGPGRGSRGPPRPQFWAAVAVAKNSGEWGGTGPVRLGPFARGGGLGRTPSSPGPDRLTPCGLRPSWLPHVDQPRA